MDHTEVVGSQAVDTGGKELVVVVADIRDGSSLVVVVVERREEQR